MNSVGLRRNKESDRISLIYWVSSSSETSLMNENEHDRFPQSEIISHARGFLCSHTSFGGYELDRFVYLKY